MASEASASSALRSKPALRASMIDCHAHLADTVAFPSDTLAGVLSSALASHVSQAIVVPMSLRECRELRRRCAEHPKVMRPAAGVHPVYYSTQAPSKRALEEAGIVEFVHQHHDKLVCIGECGLDFSPWILVQAADVCAQEKASAAADSSAAAAAVPSGDWKSRFDEAADAEQRAAQVAFLRVQIRLALKYDLSLNLHSRSASKHLVDVLKEEQHASQKSYVGVLLHAFDGSAKTLREAVQLGYYFSATTSLGRDPQMQKVISAMLSESKPIQHTMTDGAAVTIPSELLQIVLESDAPALHPIKQPPPSASAVSATSGSSSSCCAAENNQPSNLYLALLELHDLYLASESARATEMKAKAEKKAAAMARQSGTAGATETPPIAAGASQSGAPHAPLDLDQFAHLLHENTLRLFPRLATHVD
jgi:TatD DNase family protein